MTVHILSAFKFCLIHLTLFLGEFFKMVPLCDSFSLNSAFQCSAIDAPPAYCAIERTSKRALYLNDSLPILPNT